MKIIAGIGYDDRLPNQLPELFSGQLCGEQTLIAALEFRAGTLPPNENQATRTVAYLNALTAADNGNRFYSESLAVDPIASAESLLAWRDWAILHGWNHDSRSTNHGRMVDLAAAESGFSKNGTSLGERIYALLQRLTLLGSSVSCLELHHSRASWPPLYQHLFDQLESTGVSVTEAPTAIQPQAPASSDLGQLQRALVSENNGPVRFQEDGTVRLLSSASEGLAAQYAVHEANNETLIIAPSGQHSLATVIAQQGGNDSGLGDLSKFRAPNQLLLLMLQSAWRTPPADALLQFLSLPAGRFQRLRRSLARRFRDLPGFDREHWEAEINAFVNATLQDTPELDETALRRGIEEWLPICICPYDDKMRIELALSLTDRVASYWNACLSTSEREQAKPIYSAAYAAADSVCQALREWPETYISKTQLNRLISMVLSLGNSSLRNSREVSEFDVVSSPEVVPLRTAPTTHTLWINPQISRLVGMPPFSQAELRGIPLAPSPEQQTHLRQFALIRAYAPLLAAQEFVTLISTNSTPELLQLQISSLTDTKVWPSLEQTILTNQGLHAPAQPVKEFSLPQAQRWWTPDCAVPAPRNSESYSSLAALALRPHEYALKYAAQIREGAIESLAADARLKGNLAHHLVEAWIREHPWTGKPVDRMSISSWLDANLPVVKRKVALPLAQPGMQVEQLRFQQKMLDALDALLKALVAAGVTNLQPERRFEHIDTLSQLEGTMDIFCEFEDGRFAIIDMKWGGYKKYREELKAGRPLQLATYAHIAEGNHSGQLADAGYFILSRAELLCNDTLVFPTATAVEPDQPTSLQLTWQKFENTLRWRVEQLKNGHIEQTYGDAAPDGNSLPPGDALDLIALEEQAHKSSSQSYKASFKAVDTWRNLTGNIKEL
ncbi:hypothetical protein [Marinobacter sp. NFXS9]|uniref:PD-(D/E)XK nuclease family protein n=1 Tax=Marinobacter sp. NFXS9 TaxID=2818433 RepID=UPI0032DFC2B8